MQESETRVHWTKELFVEHPELYLPFLEEAKDRAEAETAALAGMLAEFGVREKGRVLDVACGIGRHSVPLAQRGYEVTGIDISPLFIRKAKEYATAESVHARFLVGDALGVERTLAEEPPFDAVVNMFTSHGYYGRDADVDLFSQLRRLSKPEAVLVVLTINRDWLIRNFEPEGIQEAGAIRILERRVLDLETSTMRNVWDFYESTGSGLSLKLRLNMDNRVYSLHGLKALIEQAGWRYLRGLGRQAGDEFRLGSLTYDCQAMWVVARAA